MSQARIVPPNEITLSNVTTNVAFEESEWDSGSTPYSNGAVVRLNFVLYESLTDSNSDNPEDGVNADPPTWVRLGYVNQMRMFTEAKDSQTVNVDTIDATFPAGTIYDTVAVLGMAGLTLTVEVVVSGTTEYTESFDLRDYGVDDFWEYYFLPFDTREDVVFTAIPYFDNADIRVFVEADTGEEARAGLVIVGLSDVVGTANYGSQVGLINFTDFGRDSFGKLTITPRRSVNTATLDITVPNNRVDFTMRVLRRAGGSPSLFIGDEAREATIIYGVPEEPRLNYDSPSISNLSLEVQGK